MDASETILRFKEFIEQYHIGELLENDRKGKHYLTIDFTKLINFDVELSEALEEDTANILKAAKVAIQKIDLPSCEPGKQPDFEVYVNNLPQRLKLRITSKRAANIGKLVSFEGIIRAKTGVMVSVRSAVFNCPSCGNNIRVMQNERKFKEPSRCGCGRRGKFQCIEKDEIDIQRLQLEELPENVPGMNQPEKLKVELTGGLLDKDFEIKFNPGSRVVINGYLVEVPVQLRSGGESTDATYVLQAIHIEKIEDEDMEDDPTEDEKEEIKTIAHSHDLLAKLINSVAPEIEGHETIKEGLLLQMVGGGTKQDELNNTRGDIHILMIGDPGVGKSVLIKQVKKIFPSARTANGKGASGAGLTAATIKDEFLGGWTVQAGTLVLAHKNMAIIDELDKMSSDDRSSMHEALEQQTVTISKANIQATLKCECALLAAANPKYGKFDPYIKTIAEQIELPPTLINRFDLIFPLEDVPDEKRDTLVAKRISLKQSGSVEHIAPIDLSLLRKYIKYARSMNPIVEIESEATDIVVNYYVDIRSRAKKSDGKKAPISGRQVEGIYRLAKAYAKLRLSKKVEPQDVNNAIKIMDECFRKIAYDSETQTIDYQKIETGISTSERSKISKVFEWVSQLEKEQGKWFTMDALIEKGIAEGSSETQMEKLIDYLRKKGDLSEMKGKLARLN